MSFRNYGDIKLASLVSKKKKTIRRTIPKSVKDSVWKKYFGANQPYGKCHVCEKTIHIQDFDIGHNKAVAKGGTDNINNLRPICRTCNNSMKTMSIETFKKKYYTNKPTIEDEKLGLKPFIGIVERLPFNSSKKLHLTMPFKPEDAKISFTIESFFEKYLDKKIKLTIEEIKE
jgi:hypothetical protein